MQDLLVYVTKGLSAVTTELRFDGKEIEAYVNEMIIVNLFTTITNANFDKDSIIERIKNTSGFLPHTPDTVHPLHPAVS